jgi:hypothetical protein
MQSRITRILGIQPGVFVVSASIANAEVRTVQLNRCITVVYNDFPDRHSLKDCKNRRRTSRRLLMFPNAWRNKIDLNTGV